MVQSEPFLKLKPAFKDYLWGGTKLKTLYGVKQDIVAEAWVLSVHPDGQSMVAEGPHQGMTLAAYLTQTAGRPDLPVLVKLIDAKQNLSVQVHPNDDYARVHEHDNGKSEMWYILEADRDAYLYVGFNRAVTREEVKRRVADGTIEEVLHKLPTHPGDAVFIPAGTVHAIGAGNLILEIQQSSNATYRLYDYLRRDAKGNLRQLHLDKALDVLNYQPYRAAGNADGNRLAQCRYFSVYAHDIHGSETLPLPDGSFASVVCVAGEGTLTRDGASTALRRGDCVYLPAGGGLPVIQGALRVVVIYAAG
ncbi:MAG TPA: class I mannose-6-phosphate isomerase [Candidatus Limiplasma sp.]|nr:class I mannose-6-phosphate isomerase [Candidatus Limiplasma sp.]